MKTAFATLRRANASICSDEKNVAWGILCSFLALVGKKRTKETPLKGKRWFQNSVLLEIIKQKTIEPNFSPILSPLRIPLFCCWKLQE